MRAEESTFPLRRLSRHAITVLNKTLQAYPVACCRDAQTEGLLIINGPAMPLNDAHFGGLFRLVHTHENTF